MSSCPRDASVSARRIARFSALREAIGITEDFSACLAYRTAQHDPQLGTRCPKKLGRTSQAKAETHCRALFDLVDDGRWEDEEDRWTRDSILEDLSKAVTCSGWKHLQEGSKIPGFEWQWQYIKANIEERVCRYLASSATALHSDEDLDQGLDATSSVVSDSEDGGYEVSSAPRRPKTLRENEPYVRGPGAAWSQSWEPRSSVEEWEEDEEGEDIDHSFATGTSTYDRVFSPEAEPEKSVWSRGGTPLEHPDDEKSAVGGWDGRLSLAPDTPVPARVERSWRENSALDAEESDGEEPTHGPFINNVPNTWVSATKRQANKEKGNAQKLHRDTSGPNSSGFLSIPTPTAPRPRSVSNPGSPRPTQKADAASRKPRSIDTEDGLAAHNDTGGDANTAGLSTSRKKKPKEAIESERLACDTPQKELKSTPNGTMRYGPSDAKKSKEDPVCDILRIMRNPINKEYSPGWIYVYSRSEAPEVLKIGRASGVHNPRVDGNWKSIKPGRLITGRKRDGVPRAVIDRLMKWKGDCRLGDITLEYYSAHVPAGIGKTESLIHKTLHKSALYVDCQCRSRASTNHTEWFSLRLDTATSIIGTWCEFMATSPYGENGFIREFWQDQCAGLKAHRHQKKTVKAWFNDDFRRLLKAEGDQVAEAERKKKEEEAERERRQRESELRKLRYGRGEALTALPLRRMGTW